MNSITEYDKATYDLTDEIEKELANSYYGGNDNGIKDY